jgi:hypothetical protein
MNSMNSRPAGLAAKRTGVTDAGNPAQQPPRTLMEAHLALMCIRPRVKAPLEQWQEYYQKSIALYTEIAKINWGFHRDALYWVEHEQRKAREVADAINNGTTSWNPFS